jgi:hypothetical protein
MNVLALKQRKLKEKESIMSGEFDDDSQDIPAAAPKSYLINPKLVVVLVVSVSFALQTLQSHS